MSKIDTTYLHGVFPVDDYWQRLESGEIPISVLDYHCSWLQPDGEFVAVSLHAAIRDKEFSYAEGWVKTHLHPGISGLSAVELGAEIRTPLTIEQVKSLLRFYEVSGAEQFWFDVWLRGHPADASHGRVRLACGVQSKLVPLIGARV